MKKSELRQIIKEELNKINEASSLDFDSISFQIKTFNYRTVVFIMPSVELWSYTNNLEVDNDRNSLELLGDGSRVLLIEKSKIKDIKINPGRSVQLIMGNGKITIQR